MMSEAPSVQNRPRVVGKAAGDAKRAAISLPWPDSADLRGTAIRRLSGVHRSWR